MAGINLNELPNQGFHITTKTEQELCFGKCPAADLCERRRIAFMSRRCQQEMAKISKLKNDNNQQ